VTNGLLSKAKRKNYLFVEGSEDKHVFIHLLNSHGITTPDPAKREHFKDRDEHFGIKVCGSITELLTAFRVELKGDIDNKRYGIVIDADADDNIDTDTGITVNWRRLLNILNNSGYSNLPLIPDDNGVKIKQDGLLPVVGIWVMPNNKLPGAIEDFVSFLGPEHDELWPIAESACKQAISVKCNFRPTYTMKAHLHTWLAWQEEPGTPMGQAITKKYVNADAPHALRFIAWFRNVFDLEIP